MTTEMLQVTDELDEAIETTLDEAMAKVDEAGRELDAERGSLSTRTPDMLVFLPKQLDSLGREIASLQGQLSYFNGELRRGLDQAVQARNDAFEAAEQLYARDASLVRSVHAADTAGVDEQLRRAIAMFEAFRMALDRLRLG